MRIDEFSNMGAGASGLTQTERMRFLCFGFDLVAGVVTAFARLAVTAFAPTVLPTSFAPTVIGEGDTE